MRRGERTDEQDIVQHQQIMFRVPNKGSISVPNYRYHPDVSGTICDIILKPI